MRNEWILEESGPTSLLVLPRPSATPAELARALPPRFAVRRLRAWDFDRGAVGRALLRQVYRALFARWGLPGPDRESFLLDSLARAVESGGLLLLERRHKLPQVKPVDKPTPPPASEPPPPPKKTWVEIVLLDEEGVPVAEEKYSLELPDGSVKEGALDSEGKARVDDIEDGTCWVTFPEIKVRPRPAGAGA